MTTTIKPVIIPDTSPVSRYKTYKDHTLEMTEYWRIRITGPTYGGEPHVHEWADTIAEAKAIVDRRTAAARAAERVQAAIPVITEEGEPATVTGIHAGNGKVIVKGHGIKLETLYPDNQEIARVLKEQAALYEQLRELRTKLEGLSVKTNRTWGRPEDPAKAFEGFQQELERKTKSAASRFAPKEEEKKE